MILLFLLQMAMAQEPPAIVEQIQSTRSSISAVERQQREALSTLFVINKQIKSSASKRTKLNQKLMERESSVRATAQEVEALEAKREQQNGRLNHRLRTLYQERNHNNFQWLFSARSPIELERNHRFQRRMVESDHQQLKKYLAWLRVLGKKRDQLKGLVVSLARTQKDVQAQERDLSSKQREKAMLVAQLKQSKNLKLSELKELRGQALDGTMSFAFFERKGQLRAPVEAPVLREYGTYVDRQYRFRLMHKGLFYGTEPGSQVRAVSDGRVVMAGVLPGYGKAVILDHGDSYYSVYAFAHLVKVREGSQVREGDVVAVSGGSSPLFGPGLYFEIRHFTDAIDPRLWIKESVIKTANN